MPDFQLAQLLPYMQEQFAQGKSVQIRPGGISMLPMLHPGRDVVELSPLPEKLKKNDLPLYRRKDGSFVLHRIVKVGETYTCVGDNQQNKEPGICREQMVALTTAFVRNGHRYSVDHPGYRLYCLILPVFRVCRSFCRHPKYYVRRALSWMISKP